MAIMHLVLQDTCLELQHTSVAEQEHAISWYLIIDHEALNQVV